jgi:type VII secretion integral membrane protein EccD
MTGGTSRVTIVAPRSRVDLALPSDVALADLLPTLLDVAGSGAVDDPAGPREWGLSRLGGAELDTSRTPSQLDVRDGELLYLRPRGSESPAAVYDDLVDALATGTQAGRRRWTAATTRSAGLTAAMLVLLAGAAAVPFAGPPYPVAGAVALGLAGLLILVAAGFARAFGDARAGTAFALAAAVYAGIGGLVVLAPGGLAGLTVAQVAVGATAATLAAVLGAVAVPSAARIFLGAGLVAVAGLSTVAIAAATGQPAAAGAAITVVAAYATLPLLPMLAYRLAGLPAPVVPTERDGLRQDEPAVDGQAVLDRARRADSYLSALVATLAVISAGAAVVVSLAGPAGRALAAVLGLLALLRARWFTGLLPRLTLLLSGAVALAADAVIGFLLIDRGTRLLAVLVSAVAVTAVGVAAGLASGRPAPIWGRVVDAIEVVLILALIPLAVLVSGAYTWIRAVRG